MASLVARRRGRRPRWPWPTALVPARQPPDEPPAEVADDPLDRHCRAWRPASCPPTAAASYDVRTVVADVVDDGSFLELRARYAPNIVTGSAASTAAPSASSPTSPSTWPARSTSRRRSKAARFVQWCDAFNLPLVTFVDTPGFQPGKDLEWRGMIRHGAELVHAYAEATVPRVCVVLRKAYGGAYIVMDSKGMGNDVCFAWPGAEIAVMGAKGAVQILFGKRAGRHRATPRAGRQRAELEADYEAAVLHAGASPPSGASSTTSSTPPTPAGCWSPRAAPRLRQQAGRRAVARKHAHHAPVDASRSQEGPMLLDGKTLLVTGVLTDASIAFSVARRGPGAGRRDRAHVVRPGHEPHRAGGQAPARRRPTSSSSTSPTRRTSTRCGAELRPALGPARRRRPRHRLRARGLPGRRLPAAPVGRRGHRAARVGLLAEGAGRDGACR